MSSILRSRRSRRRRFGLGIFFTHSPLSEVRQKTYKTFSHAPLAAIGAMQEFIFGLTTGPQSVARRGLRCRCDISPKLCTHDVCVHRRAFEAQQHNLEVVISIISAVCSTAYAARVSLNRNARALVDISMRIPMRIHRRLWWCCCCCCSEIHGFAAARTCVHADRA